MTRPDFLRIAAVLTLFLIPVTLFSEPDETMPGKIPAEILADWQAQGGTAEEIKASLPAGYAEKCDGSFESACHWRRVARMKPYMTDMKKVLYAKHFDFGGPIVGYLEGTRTARGSEWKAGSGLYILTMDNYYPEPEALLEDPRGVIKDPCISPDGSYMVFSWYKSADGGGFHIYEINMATKETRQITDNPVGLEVGDYEPCILPSGDILFNSSRVFGMIDCAYTLVSNLYMCNRNGDWLRRIGYDQEHTFHPTVMSDGKVLYTRWEYNDRTRISVGGYFTMNPDGCMQNEYWGNQSDFPLMKYQGREIPNSGGKLMGIAGGHLAPYQGELVLIDPNVDRNRWPGNDNKSIKLLAPVRDAPMDPSDALNGHDGGVKWTFQNPWPFDEDNFLVSYSESADNFKVYFMNADASRELIAWDAGMSVSQPIVIDPPCPFREKPLLIRPMADYTKKTAVLGVANVYYGMGSVGIEKGSIKKLRVIGIGPYRTLYAFQQAIAGFSVNPVGVAMSSWQIKTLWGDAPVEEDGSACFEVPANTPFYLQMIDKDGRMVNTIRSWLTMMPGERWDCVGCHENKNEAPPSFTPTAVTPKPLNTPLGFEGTPMSFPKIVQPVLNTYCISCHNASHEKGLDLRANPGMDSTLGRIINGSYDLLTRRQRQYVDWITQMEKAKPRTRFPVSGSGTSPLANKLLKGHAPQDMPPEALETIFCWIDMMVPHAGSYSEGMSASDSAAHDSYMAEHRYKHAEWEKGNIEEFIAAGQWNSEIYQTVGVADPGHSDEPNMRDKVAGELRVIPFEGRLIVQCPGTGIISLLDMKGRLLKDVNVKEVTKSGRPQAALPWIMPSGIYIVRFKSNDVVRQRIVSSL
ncbi:MAG: PD40 domain-containing protein [Chitinispirillaceae bacterium]|nr:PD40 domain-containing protein [Chitinispirillaceae bacterium]